MNEYRQIKSRLKEAGIYLRFLHEDIDSVRSIRASIVSQIDQLLKEATQKLREAGNLLNIETKGNLNYLERIDRRYRRKSTFDGKGKSSTFKARKS